MAKYLSGRFKRTPQSGLSSERFRYLSPAESEPNLGDPVAPGDAVPSGQQYQIVSVPGNPGKRYWVPIGGGIIPGSLSVFDEGSLVGGLSSTTQLNFVGAAVSSFGHLNPDNSPGVAVTVRIFAPGNNTELLFNSSNEFSSSSKLKFDSSTGLLSAGDRIQVGSGGTVITTTGVGSVGIKTSNPTQELDVNGDIRLRGTIFDWTNSGGNPNQIIVKNNFGGISWIDQTIIRSGAGGTYQNIQYHNSAGLVDGAPTFVYDEVNDRVGIGSTKPTVSLDVRGTSKFTGQTQIDNLNVTGVTTTTTLAVSGTTTTRNLLVTGITTLGSLNGSNAVFTGIVTASKFVGSYDVTDLNVTGVATIASLKVTGLTTTQNLQVYQSTKLNQLDVTGVSTFSSQVNINNINVTGVGTFDNIKIDTNTLSTNVGNLILDSTGGTTQINDSLFVNDTTGSISKSTGSIIAKGGVGIEENLNVGGNSSFTGSVKLNSTLLDVYNQVGTAGSILVSTGTGVSWTAPITAGLQGVQGSQGIQGSQGLQGNQGRQGTQGSQGTQSTQGSQGSQGSQGVQGIAGQNAGQGTQGTQGTQGLQGSQGIQGVAGQNAGQGTQGSQATQGSQGTQGLAGQNAGQGTQGTQGTQGLQGRQGTQGLAGQNAGQGTQGTQGTQGLQGIQGVQGISGQNAGQGSQGTQGTQGSQGVQGVQGLAGQSAGQGSQGTQGSQGSQGVQGIQGLSGQSAGQGSQGAQSAQGVQGVQGPAGQTSSTAANADKVSTGSTTGTSAYPVTFVANNNASNSRQYEFLYTDESLAYEPNINRLFVGNIKFGAIYDTSDSFGGSGEVITANGSGGWSWEPVGITSSNIIITRNYSITAGSASGGNAVGHTTSYGTTGVFITITPRSTTSFFVLTASIPTYIYQPSTSGFVGINYQLRRTVGLTTTVLTTCPLVTNSTTGYHHNATAAFNVFDSPNTTSSVRYEIFGRSVRAATNLQVWSSAVGGISVNNGLPGGFPIDRETDNTAKSILSLLEFIP